MPSAMRIKLKTGLYEVFGNAVEYYAGEETGFDIDSQEDVPVEIIDMMGNYLREID